MIDVQATLRARGRCIVTPAEDIVAVTFAVPDDDSLCGKRYFRTSGIYLVYDTGGVVSRTPEEKRWVSTDGEVLYWWKLDTLYRNHGRERHGPSRWEKEHDSWAGGPAWIPNDFHRLACAAYLLSFDEVKRYRSQGLVFNPHIGSWEKRNS